MGAAFLLSLVAAVADAACAADAGVYLLAYILNYFNRDLTSLSLSPRPHRRQQRRR